MKQSNLQRYVFFILLVTTQEFCSAKYLPQLIQSDGNTVSNNVTDNDNSNTSLQKRSHRVRRTVATALWATMWTIYGANLGLTVYLHIEGCCGLFADACVYEEKFQDAKDAIDVISTNIDNKWAEAENMLTYLESSSLRNEEIGLELRRIVEKYENIIETIDPNVITYYTTISNELEAAVEAGNTTVLGWSSEDLDTAFVNVFSSTIGRLQLISLSIGQVSKDSLLWTWNLFVKNKVDLTLKTNYGLRLVNPQNLKATKILGVTNVDDFILETHVARTDATAATATGAKVLNNVRNVLYILYAGVEIYAAILKVEQCSDTRDKIKEAYEMIQPEEKEMEDLYEDIVDYYNNMSLTYDTMKAQITSDDFIAYLNEVKNISDYASNEVSDTASESIQTFIDQIHSTTDLKGVYDLQGALITALESITFTLDCYVQISKIFQVAADRCKAGGDSLENIYNAAVLEFEENPEDCKANASVPESTYENVESYVTGLAADDGFNIDCLLNDAVKADAVCTKECEGKSDADIASEVAITSEYVTKFKALCPNTCPLGEAAVQQICQVKGFGMTLAQVQTVYAATYTAEQIEESYNSCE